MQREECAFILQQQPNLIYQTIDFLLRRMCKADIVNELFDKIDTEGSSSSRLVALNTALELEDTTVSTNLNFGWSFF